MYFGRKAEPRSSKLLYEREIAEKYRRHRQRLRKMKPSVDNRAPKRPKHMQRNLKREYMMEERYAKIEHENRLLLAKMSDIMRRSTLDNMSKSHKFGHSMNRTGRKVELQRITAENQKILRRLQTVQPVYSHWKWEEDRIKSEKYLETISEFKSSRKPPGGVAGRHSSAEGYTTGGIDMGGGGAAYDDRDGSRRGYDEMRASEEFGGPSYGMGHGASAPALMAPGRGHGGMATSEYDRAVLGAEDASGAYYADSKTGGTSRGDETGTMGGHDGAGGGYARGGMGASYSRGSLGAAGARAIGGGGMGGTEDGGGGGERSWGAGHSRGGL